MKKSEENSELETNIDEKHQDEEHHGNEQENSSDEIEKIQSLSDENKDLQDKLLRQMAETENVRTRSIKTLQETRDYAIFGFAKDLVPVMDNLSRALEHLPKDLDKNTKSIVEGIKMTHGELFNVFKKNHIDLILPKEGEKFDYNFHCAISQQEIEGKKSGTIISVMQSGYKIKDRLIRAASVVVSK